MSYRDGWAAINLEMPRRIPRTEYSAEGHWDLIKAVTGIDVGVNSPAEVQAAAGVAFMRAWSCDFFWSTLIGRGELDGLFTDMGHAEYAAGGVDWREARPCPFQDPEKVLNFDPWQAFGQKAGEELVRRFEAHYRANCQAHAFGVNMAGVYVTLISGLAEPVPVSSWPSATTFRRTHR